MRTTDFSRGPDLAQAEVIFIGATRFSPRSLVTLMRLWLPLKRRLAQSDGFIRLRSWYRFPFIIGSMVWFRDEASLMAFAKTPEHRRIEEWVLSPGKADAGFIRIYRANPHGYSNGAWRAESP